MDYTRKKHWVKYQSEKCKMYLRNDFKFECAYCGLREQDNIVGEQEFEKDHFVSKLSIVEWDIDSYDNMVYACSKCNGTKTDQRVNLILDPCKDNIYSGISPHIKKMGAEKQYMLQASTSQGKQFIDSLKLNSRFYRKMREKQTQIYENQNKVMNLLNEGLDKLPTDILERIKACLEKGIYSNEINDEFRCGSSKVGEETYEVLEQLQKKGISYKLCFEDEDLDIIMQLGEDTYYCEIKVSRYIGIHGRGPKTCEEKKVAWIATGHKCGVLYYYRNMGVLELYVYDEKGVKKYDL